MRLRTFTTATVLASLLWTVQASASFDTEAEARVTAILEQMTLEEKIDLLGGVNGFDVRGVPRLGVPAMAMADGPFGIRRNVRANIMAGGIALAATWNAELAQRVGHEIGRDARARGVHFYLAPGVNMYRSPLNGRNFEYLGEDPYLAARIAVPFIRGVQANGVAATIKHYLGNNSEFLRHRTDSVIDERTMREIYMPAFEAAVKQANVAAVMNAYNLVNGEHMTQNRRLNIDVLKNEWGFRGVLMSDWDATYDALGAANSGLDLEMPSGKYLNRQALLPLIKAGRVTEATIDDKVRRVLRTAARFGWLDRDQRDATIPLYNLQGREAALQTAREGIVLLKNSNKLLPLDKQQVKTIAVIGPTAYPAVPHGGGSVTVAPFRTVSLLEGISDHVGSAARVHWARGIPDLRAVANATRFSTSAAGAQPGVTVEVFENDNLAGAPASTRVDSRIHHGVPLDLMPLATGEIDLSAFESMRTVSMRWTGFHTPASAGVHDVFVQFGGFARGVGHRLYIDDRLVSDRWDMKHAAAEQLALELEAKPHKIVLEYRGEAGGLIAGAPFVRLGIVRQGAWVDAAAEQVARHADAVVLAVGFDAATELEDWDRTFALPPGQTELIQRIAAANQQVVVVMTSGGATDMSGWLDRVPSLLQAWYPGQEGGIALAEILFGDVNPSGRLPATFERRWQDNPSYENYYAAAGSARVTYKEGIFVGYRGYEKRDIQPLFPFGHGLSYTSFGYSDLAIKPADVASNRSSIYEVTFLVKNTGTRAGAAVPQVYVASVGARTPRPPKELKGFSKFMLAPGEARTITVPLDARSFAYYDTSTKRWRADAGTYRVLVGSSSANVELAADVALPKTIFAE